MRVFRSQAGRKTWMIEIRDHRGALRRISSRLGDKRLATALASKLTRIAGYRQVGEQLPQDILEWAQGPMAPWLRQKLLKWGMLDAMLLTAGMTLEQHLDDWRAGIVDGNAGESHADRVRAKVGRLAAGLQAVRHDQIEPEAVKALLATWGRKDMSLATRRGYLMAGKMFCGWMVRVGRAYNNPLKHLSLERRAQAELKVRRRPLSKQEFWRLHEVVSGLPAARGQKSRMDGPDRALLYWMAVSTSFRMNELRTLTRSCLLLDAEPPIATVMAGYSKNARDHVVPLPQDLATALAGHVAMLMPGDRVFAMPSAANTLRQFRQDLLAAGLARRLESGRIETTNDHGDRLDFHALRHTAITWWLDLHGMSVPKVQQLAGLASPQLVARYSRRFRLDDFSWLADSQRPAASMATQQPQPAS